jgi:hypothetical protein
VSPSAELILQAEKLSKIYSMGDIVVNALKFLVTKGRASLRAVQTGDRNREHAQVLAGLQAGDTVIIFPSDLVVDGVEVNDAGD